MALYKIHCGNIALTAALVPIATGTAIKTLLQVKNGSSVMMKIKEWGISFDGSAAATPIRCELIETGNVAATVTAFASSSVYVKWDAAAYAGGDPGTNLIPPGASATGYNASAEGTPTTSRLFDCQFIAPTNQYIIQFPLGLEPLVQVDGIFRIRVTAIATVNAYCYVIVEV